MAVTICSTCGKEWMAKGRKRKYCSRECFYKAETVIGKTEKTCSTCKKKFIVDGGHINRKYCSYPCSVKDRHRDNWNRYDERICQNCQKTFKIISWRKDRFCSHKCSTDANRGKPNWRQKSENKSRNHCRNKYTTSEGRKVLIHRHVVEQHIGRYLSPKEIVHHIDLDRSNIDINNLSLMESEQEHQLSHRSVDKLIKPLLERGIIQFLNNKYEIRSGNDLV